MHWRRRNTDLQSIEVNSMTQIKCFSLLSEIRYESLRYWVNKFCFMTFVNRYGCINMFDGVL